MLTTLISLSLLLSPQMEDALMVRSEEVREVELWTLCLVAVVTYVHTTIVESRCWYNRWPWCGTQEEGRWYVYRARLGWGRPTAQQVGVAWSGSWCLFRGFVDIPSGSRLTLFSLVNLRERKRTFFEAVQGMSLPSGPSSVVAFTEIGGFNFLWIRRFYGFCFGAGIESFPIRPYVFRGFIRGYYVSPYKGALQGGIEFCIEMRGFELGVAYRHLFFLGRDAMEEDFGGIFFWLGFWL